MQPWRNPNHIRARRLTESVVLDGLRQWMTKLAHRELSENIAGVAAEGQTRKLGQFKWDLTGPSYLHPVRRVGTQNGFSGEADEFSECPGCASYPILYPKGTDLPENFKQWFASWPTQTENGCPIRWPCIAARGRTPHAHLMISERVNDGIERDAAQWFRRYNGKDPEKGGARKSMATRPKDWLEQTRKDWADHANQALARAGIQERITGASLEQQYRDALEAGDDREAARLEHREPGVHIVAGITDRQRTSAGP